MRGFRVVRRLRRGFGEPAEQGGGDLVRRSGRIFHGSSSRRRKDHRNRLPRPVISTCRPFRVAKVSGLPRPKVSSLHPSRSTAATRTERGAIATRTGAVRPESLTGGRLELRRHG